MAIDTHGIRVVLDFTRGGGEIAQTTHWVAVSPAGGTLTQPEVSLLAQLWLDGFDTEAWDPPGGTGLKTLAGSSTIYTGGRIYYYPAGSTSAAFMGEYDVLDAAAGTQATGHPFSDCVVCSLRSTVPGRRGRGRMYLPLNAILVSQASGQYSAEVQTVADRMEDYFNYINGTGTGGILDDQVVAVASEADGVARGVVRIVVDSLPDTQRRRDNDLTPAIVAQRLINPL